jgi:hypothetical protein
LWGAAFCVSILIVLQGNGRNKQIGIIKKACEADLIRPNKKDVQQSRTPFQGRVR